MARLFGDQPVSLGFRALRRVAEFGHMLLAIVRPARRGEARRSSSATPTRYREIVNALEPPPDRPMPLHKLERAVPGEATMIRKMARVAAEAVITNYCEMKVSDCSVPAMRDQHAKTHGCVKAEFIVRDDLPAEFTTDLFRPGARYPATVRFSNGRGTAGSDRRIDARGLSIKLHEVGTDTILRMLAPDKALSGEHDFALSSFPIFFCKNVIDYTLLMNAVSAPNATWREKLGKGLRWLEFVIRCPRQFYLFVRTALEGLLTIRNPLTATYHSMSPFLFGEHKVVRYLVGPAGGQDESTTRWWTFAFWARSKSFLQDALVRDLDPRTHQPGGDVVLEFSIRVRHAATTDDVEDASRWWTRPQDQVVRLGSIAIPKQSFLTQNALYDCEHMVFNPWNCLPEHRPLGSVNRMRLAVYLASRQVRRKLNMVAS
jgi:catalase